MRSFRICSRLPTRSLAWLVTPVTFAPGLFRLATKPAPVGSPTLVKTMEIVVVAAFAACAASVPNPCYQHVWIGSNKVCSQLRQALRAPFSGADTRTLGFFPRCNPTRGNCKLQKRLHQSQEFLTGEQGEVTDPGCLRGLRARGERPCNGCSEKRGKFAPSHGVQSYFLRQLSDKLMRLTGRSPYAVSRRKAHVRFGSKADITPWNHEVCLTPESGHCLSVYDALGVFMQNSRLHKKPVRFQGCCAKPPACGER